MKFRLTIFRLLVVPMVISRRRTIFRTTSKGDEVLRVRAELRDAVKDGDTDRYMSIMQSYPDEYRASIQINKIENARKRLSSQIKKVRENKRLSDTQKKSMIEDLKKRQDALVGRGNKVLAGVT